MRNFHCKYKQDISKLRENIDAMCCCRSTRKENIMMPTIDDAFHFMFEQHLRFLCAQDYFNLSLTLIKRWNLRVARMHGHRGTGATQE